MTNHVGITDKHVIRLLLAEKERRGNATVAGTANDLILERCVQLEHQRTVELEQQHNADPATTHDQTDDTPHRRQKAAKHSPASG